MFCTKCGRQIPEGVKFCTKCGNPLPVKSNNQNDRHNNNPIQKRESPKGDSSPSQSNGGRMVPITVIVLLALVVVGLIVFIIASGMNGNKSNVSPIAENSKASISSSSAQIASQTEPSQSSAVPESSNNREVSKDYILEFSSTRILSNSELTDLSAEELRIARNEIYARHGRKFKDKELQDYFNTKPWYHGTIEPNRFNDNSLSDIEMKNRDLIQEYEKKRGG